MKVLASRWGTVIALCGALLAACSEDSPTRCGDGSRCVDVLRIDVVSNDDGILPRADVPALRSIVSVRIDPPMAALTTNVGTPAMQALRALATYTDGTESQVDGSWSLMDNAVGDVEPVTGLFTANAVRGGVAQVQFRTASSGGGSASATVTVTLTQRIGPMADPLGAMTEGRFVELGMPVTDATARAEIDYPLDGVMFPQNITPPLVQWGRGVVGDVYRLRYQKVHITVTQYIVHTGAGFTFSGQLPDDVWPRIAETDPGQPATLTIDRLDVAMRRVVAGASISMQFAPGSVSGIVYYWSMAQGQLHRIPAGTTSNQRLFPAGIVGTAGSVPTYRYSGCIACHQLSRDGRYLLANGDLSYVFDLSMVDPTGAMVPVLVRAGYRWYFSTMSPDNTRILGTMGDATLTYVDSNLAPVTIGGSRPPMAGVAHPYWSPDNRAVAIISNVTGWTTNASFTGGDLTLLPITALDTFGPPVILHRGASLATMDPAGGNADCFPSWTPDSRYLVFAHTPNTRATTGDGRTFGSMYIIPPVAGGTPVRLGNAADEGMTPRAHYPNLSPFISGGQYWIVFYSDRFYGNALAGTRGTHRPQLWVSAISQTFDGRTDPSHVPYWLPGQDVAQQNADAVWAASACRRTTDTCRTSTDCCSGSCMRGADGMFRCMPPPSCRREGESCDRDADCCGMGMLMCDTLIRTCQRPIG